MEWLFKIIEIIKLPAKYIFCVFLVSAALLFVPIHWLEKLHLKQFASDFASFIGIIFLFSAILVGINCFLWTYKRANSFITKSKIKKLIKSEIKRLDNKEKSVLREFFFQGQHTIHLPIDHPIVAGLISKGILQQIGELGEHTAVGFVFATAISEEAQAHLTTEAIGLPKGQPTESEIQTLVQKRPDFIHKIEEYEQLFRS